MAIDADVSDRPKRARVFRAVLICVLVLGAGVVVGWAGTSVLTPTRDVLESTQNTYVEVTEGEVGSSIRLNTAATWTPVPVGANLAQGVVTSVDVNPGDEVSQGSTLYSVNLRPTMIAQGLVPAFRSIGPGASGDDVKQVQQLLNDSGFLKGGNDGKYGTATAKAINAWQKSHGLPVTGVIESGDLIFVPALPTRISLNPELVARGLTLAGGEQVVNGLPESPAFQIPVTDAQARMIPVGTRAEIEAPDGTETWIGIVTDQIANTDDGTLHLTLNGEGETPICGESCGSVPVAGRSLLSTNVITVSPVTGLIIPSAALRSEPDGRVSVIDADGESHVVTVSASAKGMSVVDGVSAGMKVRIPANADGAE
jgi:hypothetical protein